MTSTIAALTIFALLSLPFAVFPALVNPRGNRPKWTGVPVTLKPSRHAVEIEDTDYTLDISVAHHCKQYTEQLPNLFTVDPTFLNWCAAAYSKYIIGPIEKHCTVHNTNKRTKRNWELTIGYDVHELLDYFEQQKTSSAILNLNYTNAITEVLALSNTKDHLMSAMITDGLDLNLLFANMENGQVGDELNRLLNTTLCGNLTSCPTRFWRSDFSTCQFYPHEGRFQLKVRAPTVEEQISIYKIEAPVVTVMHDNRECEISYQGVKHVALDRSKSCYFDVPQLDSALEPTAVYVSSTSRCGQLSSYLAQWKLGFCSQPGQLLLDHKIWVQRSPLYTYVYCYPNKFVITEHGQSYVEECKAGHLHRFRNAENVTLNGRKMTPTEETIDSGLFDLDLAILTINHLKASGTVFDGLASGLIYDDQQQLIDAPKSGIVAIYEKANAFFNQWNLLFTLILVLAIVVGFISMFYYVRYRTYRMYC